MKSPMHATIVFVLIFTFLLSSCNQQKSAFVVTSTDGNFWQESEINSGDNNREINIEIDGENFAFLLGPHSISSFLI